MHTAWGPLTHDSKKNTQVAEKMLASLKICFHIAMHYTGFMPLLWQPHHWSDLSWPISPSSCNIYHQLISYYPTVQTEKKHVNTKSIALLFQGHLANVMIPNELLPHHPFSSSILVVTQHFSRQVDIKFTAWELLVIKKVEKSTDPRGTVWEICG